MVLKDISLTIRSRDVIAPLGRSGSGKSTLLKAMLALVPTRSGEILNQTVRKLAHSGITMLISTHDVRFARSVTDRIIFLQDGRIIEETTPAGMAAPQTPELQAFLRHADTVDKQAVLF